MSATAELQELLSILKGMDRRLDEFERTRDPEHFNFVQKQLKDITPSIQVIARSPEYKTPENGKLFVEVSNVMKAVLSRTKQLASMASSAPLPSATGAQRVRKSVDASSFSRSALSEATSGSYGQSTQGYTSGRRASAAEQPMSQREDSRMKRYSSMSQQERKAEPQRDEVSIAVGTEFDYRDERLLKDVEYPPKTLSGYFRKQGEDKIFKNWKRRWFQQRNDKIEYYKSESEAQPQGVIDINSIRRLVMVKDPKFGFDLETDFRVYHLQAEKKSELEGFVKGLLLWKSYYHKHNKSKDSSDPTTPVMKKSKLSGRNKEEKKREEAQRLKDDGLHQEIVDMLMTSSQKDAAAGERDGLQNTPGSVNTFESRNGVGGEGYYDSGEGDLGTDVISKNRASAAYIEANRSGSSRDNILVLEERRRAGSTSLSSSRHSTTTDGNLALSTSDSSTLKAEFTEREEALRQDLQGELTQTREKLIVTERELKELRDQLVQLGELERQQREAKVELEASVQSYQDERKKRRKLEGDLDELRTKYEIERRNWKEERHELEEECVDLRRLKASLQADNYRLSEDNSKLQDKVRNGRDEIRRSPEEEDRSETNGTESSGQSARLQSELLAAQQMESEERSRRRRVEEERDDLQRKLDSEEAKRDREERRRKEIAEEAQKYKFELETEKKKYADLKEELEQERRERWLEEKKRESGSISQGVDSGRKPRRKRSDSLQLVSDMKEVASLTPTQYDAVMDRLETYVERFSNAEDELAKVREEYELLKEKASKLEDKVNGDAEVIEQLQREMKGKDDHIQIVSRQLEEARITPNQNGNKKSGGGEKQETSNLKKQLEKWREAARAHQSQNALLSSQMSTMLRERDSEVKAKEDTIVQLRREVQESRKANQKMRQVQLLQHGMSEEEIETLEDVKRELFYSLALFIKMTLAEDGTFCNLNVGELFDEAKDMDYRTWRTWIRQQYEARTTSMHTTSYGPRLQRTQQGVHMRVGSYESSNMSKYPSRESASSGSSSTYSSSSSRKSDAPAALTVEPVTTIKKKKKNKTPRRVRNVEF